MHSPTRIFAPSKVNLDHQKIEDYLNGKEIFPTTMEIDLTQLCTRVCPACPYSVSRQAGLTLQLPFLDRLFAVLGPNTPGVVFSGGESTIVPHFPDVLALARKRGFKEIAVISNGANIHVGSVQEALMEHATSIRISLYDWQDSDSASFLNTLKKIETFREQIDRTGSHLEIGASLLTRCEFNSRYTTAGLRALDAGIHWLYFHPFCIDWDQQYPKQADQTGVLEAIRDLQLAAHPDANIQVPYERYNPRPLFFEKMHGSHFLIQVGADGINYVGPECKYEEDAVLLDLNLDLTDHFLWHPKRVQRLNEINSNNYRFIGTKHRPPMFSDYIQRMKQCRTASGHVPELAATENNFSYPNII